MALGKAWTRSAALAFLVFACLGYAANVSTKPERSMLVASDLHLNPFYDPALVPQLLQADATQWEALLNRSRPVAFSPYGQDTNWWLLKSALDRMRAVTPHPAVIMIAGDLLAHEFPGKFQSATHDPDREHYRVFVRKTVQFIAGQLRKRWPSSVILLTPGNNDNSCGNYSIEPNGAFLNDTADIVRELAKGGPEVAADWKRLGSFTVQPPELGGLQIVSLNTVFFSRKYQARDFPRNCEIVASSGPRDNFDWLQQKLTAAQQGGKRVWLLFHIPPGIDGYSSTHPQGGYTPASCRTDVVPLWGTDADGTGWTNAFDHLLDSLASTVMASFAGHLHTDDFRVIPGEHGANQFVVVNPPVSPVYRQNPGFRVFRFALDGSLQDQTTYYLSDLERPDPKLKGSWRKEYDFQKAWNAHRLDAASLGRVYGEIASSQPAQRQWLKFWTVSSAADEIPPNTARGLYCAIAALGEDEYATCACQTPP